MVFVIIEDKDNHINSIVESTIARFPKEVVVHVYDRKIDTDLFQSLMNKPLLFKAWLIIFENYRVDQTQLRKLSNTNNLLLFRISNKRELNKLSDLLGNIPFEVRDNSKIDSKLVIEWIAKDLNCAEDAAKELYNRCNGYLRSIDSNVSILRNLDSVTVSDVKKYVTRESRVRSFDVVNYLLIGSNCAFSYKDIVKYVYEYRYAFVWLLETIINSLELYAKIFLLETDGSLSLKNYRKFLQTTDDKTLASIAEYRVVKILEMHEKVSLEYVYYLLSVLRTIPASNYSVYRLVELLRVV